MSETNVLVFVKNSPYGEQITEQLDELNSLNKNGLIDEFLCMYKSGDEYHHLWSGTDNIYQTIGKLESMKQKQLERLGK